MLEGSKPFLFEGSSRESVLCLHGFSGSPGIYRKIGRILQQEGLTVYAPRLPGHGTVPEDLLDATNEQFTSACECAFNMLAEKYEKVHVIGLSIGGGLATLLAANHAEDAVLGCVSLLSPGYAFNPTLAARIGLGSVAGLSEYAKKMISLPQRKINNDEMDECLFGYGMVPFVCFSRLQMLNAAARDARALVKAPVMLLYSGSDVIVDASASTEAADIFSSLKEKQCFEQSEHNLLLGHNREEVTSRLLTFILEHRHQPVLKNGYILL